jgi:hypothetical protein
MKQRFSEGFRSGREFRQGIGECIRRARQWHRAAAVDRAVQAAAQDHVAAAGEPFDMPLADIEPLLKAAIAKWADVVKRAGINVEQGRGRPPGP